MLLRAETLKSSINKSYGLILKWAGGKQQLLPNLLPKPPQSFNRYIEPFFGGGALFFALQPDNAIISESNPELINLYRTISKNVDSLIQKLYKFRLDKEKYLLSIKYANTS